MRLRDKIIHTASHEAEKNKNIVLNEMVKLEIYETHAKAWVKERTDSNKEPQPILLLNCDRYNKPHSPIKNYGVLVMEPTAGRYGEAVGILVRKTFSSEGAIKRVWDVVLTIFS